MADRSVYVGIFPETIVLDPGDQVSWLCEAGNLRIEFDTNRCPFSSNVFQAPPGMRLLTGPARPGSKAGGYKYRVWINDQLVGRGEVLLREQLRQTPNTLPRALHTRGNHVGHLFGEEQIVVFDFAHAA